MNGFRDPDPMQLETFGDVLVFRPRLETELVVRAAAERHLRARFNVGIYHDKDAINAILQHNFAFYAELLERILPGIASMQFFKFVLYQFDQYVEVARLQREGQLGQVED